MKEMMRANDRALANIESIPEGFNELRKMHHMLDSSLGASEERKKEKYERLQHKWSELRGDRMMTPMDEWSQMFRKFSEVLDEKETSKMTDKKSHMDVSQPYLLQVSRDTSRVE